MKENTNTFFSQTEDAANEKRNEGTAHSSPNQREQLAEEGQVRRALNADSYDDEYESEEEDEIIREEGRTEKDNLPGKS